MPRGTYTVPGTPCHGGMAGQSSSSDRYNGTEPWTNYKQGSCRKLIGILSKQLGNQQENILLILVVIKLGAGI